MREKPADWTDARWREHLVETLESRKKRLALLKQNKAPKRLIEREEQLLREAELNANQYKKEKEHG